MKKIVLFLFISFQFGFSQEDLGLDYYFDTSIEFDKNIPTPQDILHFTPGEMHVSHDRMLEYFRALAAVSDRVEIENRGFTYENRPLILLTITSPENHSRKTEILSQRKAISQGNVSIEDSPVVIYQGYSVHGNEPSGVNAALLYAYYLAANQSENVEKILNETVVLLDPSLNPDGIQRFANWVNINKSEHLNPDPNDREYDETWPGGRTNHYWFDLNRDWLPLQHPSSRARIKSFYEWYPNVLTDHHEMYPNSSYFFQPGIPERTHPLTPEKNQELTEKIAQFHARALDEAGSFYYAKESFDDFYYGKGSTYPDINGAIGILFEQASSRGHAQETDFGLLTFPFTIKNQLITSISTLEASYNLRDELQQFQVDFYNEARNNTKETYVFSTPNDPVRSKKLVHILQQHQVDVYRLNKDEEIGSKSFLKEESFAIPLRQAQRRLIEAMFEDRTNFMDSLFYDVSAFSFRHSFNLDFASSQKVKSLGEKVDVIEFETGKNIAKSDYAYILRWSDFYSPKALYQLLEKGLRPRVATKKFSYNEKDFDYGSILIPVQNQVLSSNEIHELVVSLSIKDEVDITPISTGYTNGVNLGSPSFKTLKLPKVAMLVGDGINVSDAGEIWFNLDQHYQIPLTKLDTRRFSRIDLSSYTHLILPNAYGSTLSEDDAKKIKSWVRNGGQLIAYKGTFNWLKSNELLSHVEIKKNELTASDIAFEHRSNFYGAQRIGGAIFETELDLSHPINFGFHKKKNPSFRNTSIFIEEAKNSFENPIKYTNSPLLSGYVSKENLDVLKNSRNFVSQSVGSGKVMYFTDNGNFRGFWMGNFRYLPNMLFFGKLM